jgi:hypothetical protein
MASLYYVGYISDILDEKTIARKAYLKIIQSNDDTDHVLQPALLSLAKIELEVTQSTPRIYKKKQRLLALVLPLLQKTIAYNPNDALSEEAQNMLLEAQKELQKMITSVSATFTNGTPLDPVNFSVSTSINTGYNSNVSNLGNDFPHQSNSAFSQATVFAKKTFIFANKFTLSPEVASIATWHANTKNIYAKKYDGFFFSTALRSRMESKLFSKPISTQLRIDYNQCRNDTDANNSLTFCMKSSGIEIIQKIAFAPTGPTYLTGSLRENHYAYDPASSISKTLSLMQTFFIDPTFFCNLTMGIGSNTSKSPLLSNNTSRLNISLFFFEIAPSWRLTTSFDLTITNPFNAKTTRGIERTSTFTINPVKNLSPKWQLSFMLNYTQNLSLDQISYAYTKVQIFTGLSTFF